MTQNTNQNRNYEIPIIGFAAYSGTGKTTLIEKLVRSLKDKGLRLAVIKHDGHRFEIDKEGKDSYRFTKAGADISIITSCEKFALMEQREASFEQVVALVRDVDLILVEGYKQATDLPQIGIARAATGKGFTHELSHFVAVVTDLDLGDEGIRKFGFDEIEEIAGFIMEYCGVKSKCVGVQMESCQENCRVGEIESDRDIAQGMGSNRAGVKNQEDFTHFNEEGRAKMVDVGEKAPTRRSATAGASVLVSRETFDRIRTGGMKKGDVLTVAQIAGVMGAKRTPDLIPMCHPILIHGVDMSLRLDETRCSVEIEATVSCDGRTGVEMEALTAASVAALTVYDMCKAVQKDIEITDIRLLHKTGGIHGDYHRVEKDK